MLASPWAGRRRRLGEVAEHVLAFFEAERDVGESRVDPSLRTPGRGKVPMGGLGEQADEPLHPSRTGHDLVADFKGERSTALVVLMPELTRRAPSPPSS